MYLDKEQLEFKWWHRLSKVLIWFVSTGVLLFCWGLILKDIKEIIDDCVIPLDYCFIIVFLVFIAPIITPILLNLFYYKVILYIAYGKK